jgi:hypothetical protein
MSSLKSVRVSVQLMLGSMCDAQVVESHFVLGRAVQQTAHKFTYGVMIKVSSSNKIVISHNSCFRSVASA